MTKLFIIGGMHCAKKVTREVLNGSEKYILLSLSPLVTKYFRGSSLQCYDLDEIRYNYSANDLMIESIKHGVSLLKGFDLKLLKVIKKKLSMEQINIFERWLGYKVLYEYTFLSLLYTCLNTISQENNVTRVCCENRIKVSLLDDNNYINFIALYFKNKVIEIKYIKRNKNFHRAKKTPAYVLRWVINKFIETTNSLWGSLKVFFGSEFDILLSNKGYEVCAISELLKKEYKILHIKCLQKVRKRNVQPYYERNIKIIDGMDAQDIGVRTYIETFLFDVIKDVIKKNIFEIIILLLTLKKHLNKNKFKTVMSGLPAITLPTSIASSFFSAKTDSSIIVQHGGSYGAQGPYLKHLYTDYFNCTDFLSFGFSLESLNELKPYKDKMCRIIPSGSLIYRRQNLKRKCIVEYEIIYPAHIILNYFEGVFDLPGVELLSIQEEILSTIKKLKLKTLLKYIKGSCAPCDFYKKNIDNSNNIKFMSDEIALQKILRRYQFKLAIIDIPSTPLWDLMPYDLEIFVYENDYLPFRKEARSLLEERVYFYKSKQELFDLMNRWRSGNIKKKRSKDFCSVYVTNPEAESRILDVMKKVMYR